MEKEENIKKKPDWFKIVTITLLLSIFVMCCVLIYYLGKLSEIWQAVKNIK